MSGPEEFESFNAELTRALRCVEAPEGFAARVMERAAKTSEAHAAVPVKGRLMAMPLRRRWLPVGGAIAASLLAGALIGGGVHEQHQRERARANQQFDLAVRVTDQALAQTREQLRQAGVPLGE